MLKPKFSFVDHRIAGWYYPWVMKGLHPTSSPLEEKMRLVKKIGYDGVGTSWWDLVAFYQERGSLEQVRETSTTLNLPVTGCTFLAEGWAFSQGERQKNAISLAKYSLDLVHSAGCEYPGLVGPFDSGDLHLAAKVFRELCQYADQFGMKLAFEFVGWSKQLNSINTALELLDLADVRNSEIVVDSYHFFAGPSTFKDLEALPASKPLVVHLADGPADLSDPAIDFARRMPGKGKLPLVEFVQVLGGKGFDGFFHLECINGDDYASDLVAVAERGLCSMKSVVEAGLSSHAENAVSY